MPILTDQTIQYLENFLDTKVQISADNRMLIFPLDDEENESITFSLLEDATVNFLKIESRINTELHDYVRFIGILEILSESEILDNVDLTLNYSNDEEVWFDEGEEEEPNFEDVQNIYTLVKLKLIELSSKQSKLVHATTRHFVISNDSFFLDVDVSKAESLLKDLGFTYTINYHVQSIEFSLIFDLRTVIFTIHHDNRFSLSLPNTSAIFFDEFPTKEQFLQILLKILS